MCSFLVVGPELSNALVESVPSAKYAGSYIGAAGLLFIEFIVIQFIDFTPAENQTVPEKGTVNKVNPSASPAEPDTDRFAEAEPTTDAKPDAIAKPSAEVEPSAEATSVIVTAEAELAALGGKKTLPPISSSKSPGAKLPLKIPTTENVPGSAAPALNSAYEETAVAVTVAVPVAKPAPPEPHPEERTLKALVMRPSFAVLASTAAILQLTMISLMLICPLVMTTSQNGASSAVPRENFELYHVKSVIQGHILGMYLPSFFTGSLMDRFGKYNMMYAGVVLNILAAMLLLTDTSSFWTYVLCLSTIGIGWNWGFVSATAALQETCTVEKYTEVEQAKAKGFNDLCIQLLGAIGTLLTGFAVAAAGWDALVCINSSLLIFQFCVLVVHAQKKKKA